VLCTLRGVSARGHPLDENASKYITRCINRRHHLRIANVGMLFFINSRDFHDFYLDYQFGNRAEIEW